jgi:hypothetical protein
MVDNLLEDENVNQYFLVTAHFIGSKRIKGARQRLYRLAVSFTGYYDGDQPAMYYDGDDLHIHVVFQSQQRALDFETQINEEFNTYLSPIQSVPFDLVISRVSRHGIGRRIFTHHYQADESESPQDALSMVSGTTVINDDSPLFKYQRLEKDSEFGGHFRADRAHLIDKSFCTKTEGFSQYNNDENNFLALSSNVHKWFDGINCNLPLFKLVVVEETRRPTTEDGRYMVTLEVCAFDAEAARMLFHHLKEGSEQTNDPLIMRTRVYVKDKEIFKKCIKWKADKIDAIWYPQGGID